MDFRAGSSPVARTKTKHPKRGALFWSKARRDLNPSKCNADERCRRRLDGGKLLFSALQKMQTSPVARTQKNTINLGRCVAFFVEI